MTTTETLTWNPKTKQDQDLKDAFSTLQASVGTVVKNVDTPNVPNRFVLKSHGFFDLRAYVMSGKDLPKNDADFSRSIPQSTLADIAVFDPEIYPKMKSSMTGIGSTCSDYFNTQQARLVTAARTAAQYSDSTIEALVKDKDTNLLHQLNIILQDKYMNKEGQDAAFSKARASALMSVAVLKSDAESNKKDIDDILEKLITFRTSTLSLQPQVKFITQQFKTGPVVNSSTDSEKKKPYLDQLWTDYNSKVGKVTEQIASRDKKYTEWAAETGVACGLAAIPLYGWFAMIPVAVLADKAKKAYDQLVKDVEDMQKTNTALSGVISNISVMITQCIDIEQKMDAAVQAMSELSDLFGNHANCYARIETYLKGILVGLPSDDGETRNPWITQRIEWTVNWLQELKTTALEFEKDITHEVKLT